MSKWVEVFYPVSCIRRLNRQLFGDRCFNFIQVHCMRRVTNLQRCVVIETGGCEKFLLNYFFQLYVLVFRRGR